MIQWLFDLKRKIVNKWWEWRTQRHRPNPQECFYCLGGIHRLCENEDNPCKCTHTGECVYCYRFSTDLKRHAQWCRKEAGNEALTQLGLGYVVQPD